MKVQILECLVLDGAPNVPRGCECVAFTVALSPEHLREVEAQYLRATHVELSFGKNAELEAALAQVEQLKAQVARAEAEAQRYRLAYDKNPPPESSRASLLEVD